MVSTVLMPAIPAVMLMVIAPGIRIVFQMTFRQGSGCFIRRALYARIQLHTRLSQRHLSAHADAATDQGISVNGLQETSEGTVAAAVGIHHLFIYDLPILHVIEFKLLRMTKVLKDFSVVVSDRNSHDVLLLFYYFDFRLLTEFALTNSRISIQVQ